MVLFIVSVLVALGVSFLCSLMEAALLSLTPSQVAEIAAKRPGMGAIWQKFKANIERPIAIILILNTAAHTIGASVAGAQFADMFHGHWIWIFSLTFTFLMLQFTEILPKTLGVRFNRELACLIGRPLNAAVSTFTPLLRMVHWINRLFEVKKPTAQTATVDEIAALASMARLSNQISTHQEHIIKSASRLSRMRVGQVMIPVEHVSFLSTSQSLPEALVAAHTDAHTRFPVIDGNDRNRIVGYVNFKEMIYFMCTNPNDPSLRGIVRPVHFVAPEESAANLMTMFIEQHIHMAIVRDKSSKTLGLVTLEDLMEELVGDLTDEFDRLPKMFHSLSGGTWMIGGGIPVADMAQRLDVQLSEPQGLVSDWLMKRLPGTPKPGDVHREAGVEFGVRRIRRGRIFEVSVSRPEQRAEGLGGEERRNS